MQSIEEMLAEKARTDPRVGRKIGDAINLHGLGEHDGWLTLKKHFEEANVGEGKRLTARILQGEAVSQREIDFIRGGVAVAKRIFEYPETALSSIERLAEKLFAEALENEAIDLEEESPYITEVPSG